VTQTSTLIQRIERVDLRVQDVDRALGFYRDIVGLEVGGRDAEHAEMRAPDGDPFLTIDSTGVTSPADRRATGLFHVAIRYPNRPALGDALARLASAGYRIGAGDHGVSEALYVDDPDGNGIELYRDRARTAWPEPRPGELVRMETDPVDLDALLADSATRGDAAAPALTDIGHVHLQVGDLDRAVDFYAGALGLDLTATIDGTAGFFASHGYHHHVGANIWNSRGGAAPRAERAGLDRVVFGVGSKEELDRARDRLVARGHDVNGSGDVMIVSDPDGIELRFVARAQRGGGGGSVAPLRR
jgi:catechol 2,3-dioxygenase